MAKPTWQGFLKWKHNGTKTIGQSNWMWNNDNRFEHQLLFSKWAQCIKYPAYATILTVQFKSKLEFQENH